MISFALSGFLQDFDLNDNPKAVPARLTTKGVLEEISYATGQDFTNGVLLLIESLDDINAPSQIVARKVTDGVTNQLDVSDFFDVTFGEAVTSERVSGATLTGATFYAIDHFLLNTLAFTNGGFAVDLQGFSRDTQTAFTKNVGGTTFNGFASKLSSDVNGEVSDSIGLLAPVKGKFMIGAPKFVAGPAIVAKTQP
jgi:hypothetical protein